MNVSFELAAGTNTTSGANRATARSEPYPRRLSGSVQQKAKGVRAPVPMAHNNPSLQVPTAHENPHNRVKPDSDGIGSLKVKRGP